ncbi:unnamed protein product, partial [marine sediment metagenome]
MRGNGDDKDATCFETHYGLRINSHDHSDRLAVTLYGLGEILAPDAGKKGYGSGLQLNWMVQTIAHNTVTINETTQYPQGDHNTVWVDPIPGRPPEGKLVFFHAGKKFKAIRAMSDKVYEGCVLDRTLILLNPFVIDIYRVSCDAESQIDWAWHGYGQAKSKRKLAQQGGSLSGRKGYMHLTNPAS